MIISLVQIYSKNKKFRLFKNFLKLLIFRLSRKANFRKNKNLKINYVVESANWSIKWDGIYMKKYIDNKFREKLIELTNVPCLDSKQKVIHFGSQYMWVDWKSLLPKTLILFVTRSKT